MHRSRKLGLLGLGTSLVLGAGCISALGDFDTGSTTPGTDAGNADTSSVDAGVDAFVVRDASSGTDGGTDAGDAAPPTLACDTWRFPTPVTIDDLSKQTQGQGRIFNGRMSIFTPALGAARVIASKNDGTPFTLYSFDEATQRVAVLPGPASSTFPQLDSLRRASLGPFKTYTEVLVRTSSPTGAQGTGYDVYMLPDTMPAAGPIPPPQTLMRPASTYANTNQIRAFPYSESDFFAAIVYGDLQTGNKDFAVGRAMNGSSVPQFSTVGTSVHKDDYQSPVLLDANGKMYMFTGNDGTVLGVSAWTAPESGSVAAPLTPRALSSGKLSVVFDAVANSTPTSANVAYAEGELGQSTFKAITLRVGTVPFDKLDTFTPADLPVAIKFPDLTVSPFGSGDNPEWRGDDLVTIGSGFPLADGGVPPGVNFLWIDAHGNVRSVQGGPRALLQERSGIRHVTAAPAVVGAGAAAWNVAWTEQRSDATGPYEVLLFNQLRCQ